MTSETAPCIVKTSASPKAQLQSIPLDAVQWTSGYWAERCQQNADITLRKLWDLLADPESGHVLDNLRIAAGLQDGEFVGTNWQDEWLYKWIEAAACVYRISGEDWIDTCMDEGIELIGQAQEDDGYVSSQITARKKPRFQDPREHEVYNMGHLLTAGVIHHRMTDKTSLLQIAIRVGDFLCNTLGVTVSPSYAHNPSAVMGLVELYRETDNEKYLDCAKRIIDGRGSNPKPGGLFYREAGVLGTDLFQDRVPLRKEKEVVGHNVFFTYLYTGAADVYLETGDETLRDVLVHLWHDLTAHKICVNGGVSPMGHGLSLRHDPICEAVGPAYHLPSAASYNETCGQIGNFLWNYRMLCIEANAAYADMMELEIYNGIQSGIGLDGASWWYRNPLRRYDTSYTESGLNDMAERGLPGKTRICCPSNLVRTVAELQSYFYSTSTEGIWIHHFGGNTFTGQLPSGETVQLEQITDYPWDGKISIIIHQTSNQPFAINVRIPQWAEDAQLSINGEPISEPAPSTYATIRRTWHEGDTINLNLPMPIRLIQAHPKAEQLRNQVAIMRGPLLYCLESPDFPEEIDLSQIYIPSDISLTSTDAPDLPFGIQALSGEGFYRQESDWNDDLYRVLQSCPMDPISLCFIPYFAWANRGPSAMSVWLPVVIQTAHH